jgi:hypothetical protein
VTDRAVEFVIRLDGPMIELVGRDFKGIFRRG